MVATQVLFPDIVTGILKNEQLWHTNQVLIYFRYIFQDFSVQNYKLSM